MSEKNKNIDIPENPEGFDDLSRIKQIEMILEDFSAYCIDEVIVDVQSANVYKTVWDAADEEQRKRLDELDIVKAVEICWRCCK